MARLHILHRASVCCRVCVCARVCVCVCSVNLMTCMGSLTAIVKQRPVYMRSVVQAFESLHGPYRLSKVAL